MVDAAKPDHPGLPHRRAPFTRRQIILQIGVAAVILVSGIAIGSGGTILALKDRIIPRFTPPPPGRPPGPEPNEIAQRWQTDYGLTDQQTQKIEETLTKQFAAVWKLRQDFEQAEQAEREKLAQATKSIFTPEQYAQWDKKMKEMAEHWQRMRAFGGRGGGRGGPRGDRPPDRRMDPNNRRGGWQPGPPRDSNNPRGDWPRGRSMGPEGRADRPPKDLDGHHGDPPPEPSMDPNGPR